MKSCYVCANMNTRPKTISSPFQGIDLSVQTKCAIHAGRRGTSSLRPSNDESLAQCYV